MTKPKEDLRDPATRAVDKLVDQKLLDPFQRYNIGQVIRVEYEPTVQAHTAMRKYLKTSGHSEHCEKVRADHDPDMGDGPFGPECTCGYEALCEEVGLS